MGGLFTGLNTAEFSRTLQMAGYSDQTVSTLCGQVNICLDDLGVPPSRVSRRMLRDYLSELSAHLSPRTLAVKIQALKKYFGFMRETGQILVDPTVGLSMPSLRAWRPEMVLSARKMDRIRIRISGRSFLSLRNRALIEVLYGTGLRASELSSLNITDIDFKDGLIYVYGGKGGRDRSAVLSDTAASALKAYLSWRRRCPDDNPALWITVSGGRMSRHVIWKVMNRLAELAGVLTPAHPHTWRHGVATALIRRGASIVAVQRFLGHASLRTTQVYTHIAAIDLKIHHRKFHPRESDPIPKDITPCFVERRTNS